MERQVHAMYFSATGTTEKVVTAIMIEARIFKIVSTLSAPIF